MTQALVRKSSSNARIFRSLLGTHLLAAVGCVVAYGCGSSGSDDSTSAVNPSGSSYAALSSQLQNCASEALDCVKAASCDATKERACRDSFDTCRKDNRGLLQAFEQSIGDCRDTRQDCVAAVRHPSGTGGASGSGGASGASASSAGSGGAAGASMPSYAARRRLEQSEAQACRDDFAMCVQDHEPAPPPEGPCMQSLHDCVSSGDQSARDCMEAAHTCFENRLPMCSHSTAGASGAAGAAGSAGAGS